MTPAVLVVARTLRTPHLPRLSQRQSQQSMQRLSLRLGAYASAPTGKGYPLSSSSFLVVSLQAISVTTCICQLKRFMRGFNGVSTKYLNNYLVWNNLVNYAKESDMEKRNIFLTFVLATLKTAKCRDLSNRPAVPLVA